MRPVLNLTILALIVLAPLTGWAQGADIARYRSSPDHAGPLNIPASPGLYPGSYRVGLEFHGAHRPLVWRYANDTFDPAIGRQQQIDLHAVVGIIPLVDFGLSLPVIVQQTTIPRAGLPSLSGSTVGDLRLLPRITLVYPRSYGFSLAVIPELSIPTGSDRRFAGEPGIAFRPTVVGAYPTRHVTWHGLFGMNIRPDARFETADFGDELYLRAGVSHARWGFTWHAEIDFATPMFRPDDSDFLSIDLLGTVRRTIAQHWMVHVGGGAGVVQGIGSPAARWMLGIAYQRAERDDDDDGIPDHADRCPAAPEDYDQFADVDGCPEVDNDLDGIADLVDRCPNLPEDINGIRDQDGCPEGTDDDLDGDGIPDSQDPCAADLESGGATSEQCRALMSDGDRDFDQIPDRRDRCPDQREDDDGFQDNDGCPEDDNDFDGIMDRDDACPNVAEDINGIQDLDGCPDDQDDAPNPDPTRLELPGTIRFEVGTDRMLKESLGTLQQVALQILRDETWGTVRIEGHTDNQGEADDNVALSQDRANRIKAYLVSLGVPPKRLKAVGYGAARPLTDNDTAEGRAKNRRVEFVVVAEGS